TGIPKAISIRHKSISNFCHSNLYNGYDIGPGSLVGQIGAITFDMCVSDVFACLSWQGTLLLPVQNDFIPVLKLCDQAVLTPSFLSKLDHSEFKNLKRIIVGGEALQTSLVNNWTPNRTLVNGYGPAEATLCSSTTTIRPNKPITIGKPIPNTVQYI
ncbi:hypothetical protein BC833DRAFT_508655, partial [Globomyces pollinis-pini]